MVALRKESVDRNYLPATACVHLQVALRKESVDRNTDLLDSEFGIEMSLSARRAWIEIVIANNNDKQVFTSLSARRAWNVSLSDCSG